MLQRGGYRDNLLHKRHFHMIRQGQSAGTGDNGGHLQFSKLILRFLDQCGQCLLNVGIMALIVREQKFLFGIQYGNFYRGGSDIDPQSM